MRIKDKKFVNYRGSLKNLIFGVGSLEKAINGEFSKKGGLGQLADL